MVANQCVRVGSKINEEEKREVIEKMEMNGNGFILSSLQDMNMLFDDAEIGEYIQTCLEFISFCYVDSFAFEA